MRNKFTLVFVKNKKTYLLYYRHIRRGDDSLGD